MLSSKEVKYLLANGHLIKMSRSEKFLTFSSSLLILSTYYYLYVVDFSQGQISGAGLFPLLKFVFIAVVYTSLLKPAIKKTYSRLEITFILFIISATLVYLAKAALIGDGNNLFLNLVICSIPFLLLETKSEAHIDHFFKYSAQILSFQVALDAAIFFSGNSLWENRAFIGGVGNPSSFGFLCVMLLAYSLFCLKPSIPSKAYVAALSAGALMSSSLLSTLLLVLVFISWGAFKSPVKLLGLSILAFSTAAIGALYGTSFISGHVKFKLASLFGGGAGTRTESSISVSQRADLHGDYFSSVSENPLEHILFGSRESYYIGVDSQIVTYLESFGALITLTFVIAIVAAIASSKRLDKNSRLFVATSISAFSISFFTNRLLDYFPVPLFLFLLICMIRNKTAKG